MSTTSVALIGSSGGGAATLGHTEPTQLLQVISNEILKIEGETCLRDALFVSLNGGRGLDTADLHKDTATLYSINKDDANISSNYSDAQIRVVQSAPLGQVNETCEKMDATIAQAILDGKIQGLICISCDPDIHSKTLQAASKMNIPVTGSGGTSLSAAVTRFQIRLVGNAGGSVANNTFTRAVSFANALATAWQVPYHPFSSSFQNLTPQWTSVLNASLPAFWAVCLARRFLSVTLPILDQYGPQSEALATISEGSQQLLVALQSYALPTACCVVMATSCAPQQGSTVVMASSIAAVACRQSILGGLLAGWLVSFTIRRAIYRCIVWNVPATMTNLVAAGGVGASVAMLIVPIVPLLREVTTWIRFCVRESMSGSVPLVGFAIGCLFCYGSKVGYYHKLCLPIILIEMEVGQASVWGSIDELTLVLVSAGICAGNLVTSSTLKETDISLCKRAVRINFLYGDFIEAAYPFMERSKLVNMSGYLASGLSTEILARNPENILSSAYLPLPVCIWLAKDWQRMALASFTAFAVSFLGAILNTYCSAEECGQKIHNRREK